MFDKYPDVVTVLEIAQMLRIGRNKVYEIIRSGDIRGVKTGRSLRITKSAVIDYISCKPTITEYAAIPKPKSKKY